MSFIQGYSGKFQAKASSPAATIPNTPPDGVAIFSRTSRFETIGLRRVQDGRPVYMVLSLKDRLSQSEFDVAMLHLKSGLENADVRTEQVIGGCLFCLSIRDITGKGGGREEASRRWAK